MWSPRTRVSRRTADQAVNAPGADAAARPGRFRVPALSVETIRPYVILAVAQIAVAIVLISNLTSGEASGLSRLPLDDAWSRMVYARSFADSAQLAFNPGDLESGITSPLWALIVGGTWKVLSVAGIGIAATAKLLGILFAVASAAFVYRIVAALTGNSRLSLAAGFIVAVEPSFAFAAVSGMEVTLFAALALASAWAFFSGRMRTTSILFALLVITRPEGWVLVVLAALTIVSRRLWEREGIQLITPADSRVLAALLAPAVVTSIAWIAYNIAATGAPLPASFYVRRVDLGLAPVGNIFNIVRGYYHHLGLFAGIVFPVSGATVIWGAVALLRRFRFAAGPLALFVVFQTYAIGASISVTPAEWNFTLRRYMDATVPFLVILLVVGLIEVWNRVNYWRETRSPDDPTEARVFNFALNALFLAVVAAPLLGFTGSYGKLTGDYSWNSRNVQEVPVAAAGWIKENTPETATIATDAPGALAYFSDRRVLDMSGVNHHEAIDKTAFEVAKDNQVDYVFVFASVYFQSWPQGQKIYEVETARNTILAARKFTGYQASWGLTFEPADRSATYQIDFASRGLQVIDMIDVGNAEAAPKISDATHDYRLDGGGRIPNKVFRISPDTVLEDDARSFTISEEFTVASRAGKRLLIAKRYDAAVGQVLRVIADEKEVGIWKLPRGDFFFGESIFVIPAEFITANRTTLRFELASNDPNASANSFFYWILVDA